MLTDSPVDDLGDPVDPIEPITPNLCLHQEAINYNESDEGNYGYCQFEACDNANYDEYSQYLEYQDYINSQGGGEIIANSELCQTSIGTPPTTAKIYLATNSGLSIYDGQTWSNLTSTDGLASSTVNDVFVKDGVIYAATSSGLSISYDNGQSWNNYTVGEVGQVLVEDGIIYLTGMNLGRPFNSGLLISKDNGVSWVQHRGPGLHNQTGQMSLKNGYITVTTWGGSVKHHPVNDNDPGVYHPPLSWNSAGLPPATSRMYFVNVTDSNRILASGCSYACGIYTIIPGVPGSYQNIRLDDGLASNQVRKIFIKDDHIYAATSGGLSISNDDTHSWVNITADDGLRSNDLIEAYIGSDEVMYIADRMGLSISYNGGSSWQTFDRDDGIGGPVALESGVIVNGLFVQEP